MRSKVELNKKGLISNLNLTGIGWELALPIVGGIYLGYRLDQHLGSQYIFTLSFLVLGIFTGYYSLYKYIELEILRTKISKLRKQKEDNTQ